MKKILVIGNGGRENAIIRALKQSKHETEIYNIGTAINPDIENHCQQVIVGDIMDNDFLADTAQKLAVDFAVVGPDDPIGNGAVDALLSVGVKSFAPTKKCAQLESSKSFTRNLLEKYNIEGSPEFYVSTQAEDKQRADFFARHNGQIVVKADGLLGGKGVLVAGDHFTTLAEAEEFAQKSIEKFGKVVLEEKMIGPEFSIIFMVDGKTVIPTPAIQDHKRAFNNDEGPNTGGMGTVSDENNSLPFLEDSDLATAKKITEQTMHALEKETGEKFVGLMYGGFMKTKNGTKLVEYNARFGDPEVYNILGNLETDFVEVCQAAINKELSKLDITFKKQATVLKYLCPEGYPTSSVKNVPVKVLPAAYEMDPNQAEFFFASIGKENNKYLLKGSRAIAVLGKGKNWVEANANADAMIKNFEGPMFYRTDIGTTEYWENKMKRFPFLP
ncbi:phosphoribosylamine--glycine ligase [bacterium DOLZORAL124_38_8]|nr:MAG: phosphoribosylamine--glycine ligase [bacterium DOLZORAL124_38_8]